MIKLIFVITTLLFAETPTADVKDLMVKSGETFSELQRAILVNKDLGPETLELSRKLTDLFEQGRNSTPNLDNITKDPKKRDELIAAYKNIMEETVNLSLVTEQAIADKNLDRAKASISKLKEKRTQGHEIFKPQGEFSNEYHHH